MTASSATWRSQPLYRRHFQGSIHGRTVEERLLRGGSSEPERAVALRHFSHWPRRIFSEGKRASAGAGGAHRGLRHDLGRTAQLIEKKRKVEGRWKSGGGRRRLYTWPSVGLADWAPPTPCPSGRAVRAVTGAAKPHGVIHRNIFNSSFSFFFFQLASTPSETVVEVGPQRNWAWHKERQARWPQMAPDSRSPTEELGLS